MKWGFTGSQKGAKEKVILRVLKGLHLTEEDWVVTGSCIGVDEQVALLTAKHYPSVKQMIIVPSNMKKVASTIWSLAEELIMMPPKTNYRDRNERIVKESDKIIAFWTGKKVFSGTYMTINIAERAGKLNSVIGI